MLFALERYKKVKYLNLFMVFTYKESNFLTNFLSSLNKAIPKELTIYNLLSDLSLYRYINKELVTVALKEINFFYSN